MAVVGLPASPIRPTSTRQLLTDLHQVTKHKNQEYNFGFKLMANEKARENAKYDSIPHLQLSLGRMQY